MIIQALGTSSSIPVADRNNSSLLVQTGSNRVLLDAGDGTARQLARFGIDPASIQACIITHAHIDHSAGLFSLLSWMKLAGRRKSFTVYMPDYFAGAVESFLPFVRIQPEKLPYGLRIQELHEGFLFSADSTSFYGAGNDHLNPFPEESGGRKYSFSIGIDSQEKKTIYTSDIQSFDHLHKNAPGCDVLICEAAHISFSEIISFALQHSIPRVALTHIPPDFSFPGSADVADTQIQLLNDGETVRF